MKQPPTDHAAARTVVVELVVAVITFSFGALVVYGSAQLGASWGADGPQSGYFPFYIGLLICISSAGIFVPALLKLKSDRSVFVTTGQLKRVMVILLPTTAYAVGVQWIGIYVSSAVFVALFMKFLGKYSWLRSVVVGSTVSISAFVLFELWFKIPLPKGPFERMIGY